MSMGQRSLLYLVVLTLFVGPVVQAQICSNAAPPCLDQPTTEAKEISGHWTTAGVAPAVGTVVHIKLNATDLGAVKLNAVSGEFSFTLPLT